MKNTWIWTFRLQQENENIEKGLLKLAFYGTLSIEIYISCLRCTVDGRVVGTWDLSWQDYLLASSKPDQSLTLPISHLNQLPVPFPRLWYRPPERNSPYHSLIKYPPPGPFCSVLILQNTLKFDVIFCAYVKRTDYAMCISNPPR